MKILALSDEVVPFIYSGTVRQRFGDVRLIVGCGDLPSDYLEYVVTQLNVPLAYVPGNHDVDGYRIEGGESVDGRRVRLGGVSVAGLGGSQRYKPQGRNQYTETEMFYRVARLLLTVRMGGRGMDLLVTHAPPEGVHDGPDLVHKGFACYHTLLKIGRPALMLHGHTHVLQNLQPMESSLYGVRIVNVYPYRVLELPEAR